MVRLMDYTPSGFVLDTCALEVHIHETWVEATRYLNMADLEEHKKELMRKIEQAA